MLVHSESRKNLQDLEAKTCVRPSRTLKRGLHSAPTTSEACAPLHPHAEACAYSMSLSSEPCLNSASLCAALLDPRPASARGSLFRTRFLGSVVRRSASDLSGSPVGHAFCSSCAYCSLPYRGPDFVGAFRRCSEPGRPPARARRPPRFIGLIDGLLLSAVRDNGAGQRGVALGQAKNGPPPSPLLHNGAVVALPTLRGEPHEPTRV